MHKKTLLVLIIVALFICLLGCSNEAGTQTKKNSSPNSGEPNQIPYDPIKPEGPVSIISGIFADTSHVTEDAGIVIACRYWPGELTLDDGTVVESANKFYIRKYSSEMNWYYLYYPATIYDTYVAGGGGFSGSRTITDSAFTWYIKTYYPEINLNGYPFNVTNTKTFCDSIMSKSFIEPLAKDVHFEKSRTTVFSDPAKLGTDLSGYGSSCINYNFYDLQNEDGTPIIDNGFYCITSWETVLVYYPQLLSDVYELVAKEGNSGSEFWTYLEIYFPDLDYNNPKEFAETLVGHFVEPRIEDYQEYFKNRGYTIPQ